MNENINPFAQDSGAATQPAQPDTNSSSDANATPVANAQSAPVAAQPSAVPQPQGAIATPQGVINSVAAKPKKSHKGLIIGIVSGVVALVLIIAGVFIFININAVSSDDYSDAMSKLGDTYEALDEADNNIGYSSVSSLDEDDINDLIDDVNKSMDSGQAKLDELGKMKAITKDTESKEKYDKLNEEYSSFKSEIESYLDNIQKILPVYTAIQEASDIDYDDDYYSQAAKAYQNIADVANKVETDDEDLSDALTDLSAAAKTYADYYTKRANDEDTDYTSVSSAARKFSNASSDISDAFSSTDITNAASKVSRAYTSLYSHLNDKYYELIR